MVVEGVDRMRRESGRAITGVGGVVQDAVTDWDVN